MLDWLALYLGLMDWPGLALEHLPRKSTLGLMDWPGLALEHLPKLVMSPMWHASGRLVCVRAPLGAGLARVYLEHRPMLVWLTLYTRAPLGGWYGQVPPWNTSPRLVWLAAGYMPYVWHASWEGST